MRRFSVNLVLIVLVLVCFSLVTIAQESLNIMSFNNISAQFGVHLGLGPTQMPFNEKRDLQVTFLQEYDPDIVGLQEADPYYEQVAYLLDHLPDYSATLTDYELAILYKHEILELKESYYIPFIPAAVARFAVKKTGHEVYLFNSHGGSSTVNAQRLVKELSDFVKHTSEPVNIVWVGDFNARKEDDFYKVLTTGDHPIFNDSWRELSPTGEEPTLDWILYAGAVKPISTESIDYTINERRVSDHPAVLTEFVFETVEASKYEYNDLKVSSTEIETGKNLEVKTTIKNLGGLGSPKVSLYVDGELVDTKWIVNFQNNESREIIFNTAFYKPGEYEIGIDNLPLLTVKVFKSVPITQLGVSSSFELSNLTLPEITHVGEEFDVTAFIKNVGRNQGSANVNLYVDGLLIESTMFNLSPGESKKVGFPLAFLKEGTYKVGIGPLSETLEVATQTPELFYDMSGNGNDATVIGGVQLVQGKVNKGIRLNGRDACLEVENDELFNIQRDFTVAVWFKGLDLGLMAGQNYLVANEGYPYGWEIEVRDTNLYFEINTKIDPAQPKPNCLHIRSQNPTLLEANRWYLGAFTIASDGTMKMYLDGEEQLFLVNNEEVEKLIGEVCYNQDQPNPLYIGTRTDRRNYFKGEIDEVMVYRKALTKEEIQQLFQGSMPSKESLVLWLSFD